MPPRTGELAVEAPAHGAFDALGLYYRQGSEPLLLFAVARFSGGSWRFPEVPCGAALVVVSAHGSPVREFPTGVGRAELEPALRDLRSMQLELAESLVPASSYVEVQLARSQSSLFAESPLWPPWQPICVRPGGRITLTAWEGCEGQARGGPFSPRMPLVSFEAAPGGVLGLR